jgi:hypothetical protein
MKKLIILYLFLTISLSYSAEKHLYVLGGGGEPKGDKTIFDSDLKTIGGFVEKSSWSSTVSFNGGHRKTEDILSSKFSKATNAGAFVEENYNKMVNEMISKIESGVLKSGDQLMVVINTHGAKNSGKEQTHQVATAHSSLDDLQTLAGASVVKLDNLQKLVDVAAEKGVKLAITDMSCFSGNLLNLKGDKACLISATGRDQFGYAGTLDLGLFNVTATFSGKFFNQLSEGKNLEEIFLKSRQKSWTADYPMISTKAGRAIDDKLYNLLSPYLRVRDGRAVTFGYSSNRNKFYNEVCQSQNNYSQIMEILNLKEQTEAVTDKVFADQVSELKKSVEAYRNFELYYEDAIKGTHETENEIRSILESKFPENKNIWSKVEPLEFTNQIDDRQIKQYQEMVNNAGPRTRRMWQSALDDLMAKKAMVEEVTKSLSPAAKEKIANYEKAFANANQTKDLATKVSSEAKKVYENLYRSQMDKDEANPCRDFKL